LEQPRKLRVDFRVKFFDIIPTIGGRRVAENVGGDSPDLASADQRTSGVALADPGGALF